VDPRKEGPTDPLKVWNPFNERVTYTAKYEVQIRPLHGSLLRTIEHFNGQYVHISTTNRCPHMPGGIYHTGKKV
jgi:hypothetical protein